MVHYGITASWTTGKEIEYLKTIGTNFSEFHAPRFTKREMLKKYITSLDLRKVWNGLSKKELLFAASEMLNNC